MRAISAFVKAHPVLTFYVLTFLISWGGVLAVLGPGIVPAGVAQIESLMLVVYLAFIAGPALAGLLLTVLVHGWAGLRELSSRLFKWKAGVRWYTVALLTAPLIATASLLALSLASSDYLPRIYTTDDKAFLVQFSIISAVIVAIFEEIGWTGFAVPALRSRYGVLATGLIAGVLLGIWHLPVIYWASTGSYGDLPPVLFLPAVLLTWLPAYRVLMVWVYDRTASVFVAIVMHVSLIAFWTMSTPLTVKGMPLVTYYFVFTAGIWLVIAAIALANGMRLSQPPLRRRMA